MNNFVFQSERGFIAYRTDGLNCYIDLVQIDKDFRDRGNGTKLVNDFFDDVSSCNYFLIEVFFNIDFYPENTTMTFDKLISFYETLGFVKDEIEWDYILTSKNINDHRIFMKKIV